MTSMRLYGDNTPVLDAFSTILSNASFNTVNIFSLSNPYSEMKDSSRLIIGPLISAAFFLQSSDACGSFIIPTRDTFFWELRK